MSAAEPKRKIETVLLDAGGVLLDLDYGYLRRLIQAQRVDVEPEQLSRFEAIARKEIHDHVANGGRVSESWRDYFHIILGHAGVHSDAQSALIDTLWEAHERFGLWTVAIDGGPETVALLKRAGFRIGVVSNAEGRVARDLDSAGYEGMFETVVDSHLVGVEKPDPGIFHIALERMGARAESAIFLGDLPAVDVAGARAAGIQPILLDRHDLYGELETERVRSIRELPGYLGASTDEN